MSCRKAQRSGHLRRAECKRNAAVFAQNRMTAVGGSVGDWHSQGSRSCSSTASPAQGSGTSVPASARTVVGPVTSRRDSKVGYSSRQEMHLPIVYEDI